MSRTERERNSRAREKEEGTQRGAESVREKPRDIRDDRCDEGQRKTTRSEGKGHKGKKEREGGDGERKRETKIQKREERRK